MNRISTAAMAVATLRFWPPDTAKQAIADLRAGIRPGKIAQLHKWAAQQPPLQWVRAAASFSIFSPPGPAAPDVTANSEASRGSRPRDRQA